MRIFLIYIPKYRITPIKNSFMLKSRKSGEITIYIENKNTIILLDRLDYVINMYGFEATLKFLYTLNDLILMQSSILLVNLNPAILNQLQINIIEQEIKKIPTKMNLNEDLKEILEFLNTQKTMKKNVTFKDVSRHFSITKTTARKRINRLHNLGVIEVKKNGRSKILSLS